MCISLSNIARTALSVPLLTIGSYTAGCNDDLSERGKEVEFEEGKGIEKNDRGREARGV